MTRFLKLVLMACLPNFFIIQALNYLLILKMTQLNIILDAIITSLIGVSLAMAIRYAVHAGRNHEA